MHGGGRCAAIEQCDICFHATKIANLFKSDNAQINIFVLLLKSGNLRQQP